MKLAKFAPNNCPVQEKTADGKSVGRCWYWLGDKGICPRHGKIESL